MSFAFIALFMSSRSLSSRGGAEVAVVDEYLIMVHCRHLNVARTTGLTVMMVYNPYLYNNNAIV